MVPSIDPQQEIDQLRERVLSRFRRSPCGIGAAVLRETTPPDLDGRSWDCVITDGSDFKVIEIIGPRLQHGLEIDEEEIEEVLERYAGNCSRSRRLRELRSLSPISFPELYFG